MFSPTTAPPTAHWRSCGAWQGNTRLSAALPWRKTARTLGSARPCNRGAAKGSAPLLFFLNLDTEVWPDVFLRLDEAAVRAPQETAAFECRQLPYETGHHIDPVTLETSWASGAALAVRRAAFTSVGGFDEHLFMYCEDVDLSWRLRAGGYRLQYVPAARVTHYSYENGGPKLGEYAGQLLRQSAAAL